MTIMEAQASLQRWRRWAAGVQARWPAGSPLEILARRRILDAELRLLEIQQTSSLSRS